MDITPFFIQYDVNGIAYNAEIRPCCKEDNVVDYAVWVNERLAFTITKNALTESWVIAMKNADELIDDALVQRIGNAIEKRFTSV